jgi:hypothetical protein
MIGYVRHSETERVWVNNDSLINLSLLKIQSVLLGNFEGYDCIYAVYVRWRRDEFAHASGCGGGNRIA